MAFTVRFATDYPASVGSVNGNILGAKRSDGSTPYVLGGVTLQTVGEPALGDANSTGWVSGDDIRLRGRWRRPNASAALALSITLPEGPGDYDVVCATTAATFQRNRWRVLDGLGGPARMDVTSVSQGTFWPDDNAPTSFDQWLDQDGVLRPIGANALVGAVRTVTISTGVLHIVNGGHPSGAFSSDLSFIHIARVGPLPSTPNAAAHLMLSLLT